MGIVYEAVDRVRGAPVALKRLDRLDGDALLRFKREFRARADLVHPNLVTLHELVGDGERWFFTMELLDGVDVLAWIRADPEPGHGRLRAAFAALVEGLTALHDAGLVHRDVKPSNVLVTGAGRVVLLDFGLIQKAGTTDSDPSIVGTPAYLAPELVGSARATPAADAYALGVMLYELLAGRQPFEGGALQVLMEKANHDPVDVRAHAPGAPADLADLAMALLARDPAARPDADAIRARLGARAAARLHPPEAAPLVGRRSELAVLDGAFERARAGRGAFVLVHGESGIGKSRLCRHFVDVVARREGALVLAGRCYERESVPYQGVDSLIDALASHLARRPEAEQAALLPPDAPALARLFPVLRRIDALARPWPAPLGEDAALRRRGIAALRELVARLAARRPLVLLLDDLQWSDADGASLLAELTREPAPPVLLIGACRTGRGEAARVLAALPDAIELEVRPLGAGETARLAALLVDDGTPEAAERARAIAREAGGHPLFVHELARGGDAPPGAVTLARVIGERVARLAPPARALLEVIAAAGRPVPLAVAERAAGAGDHAAAALRAASLVRSHGARSHDLVEPYHDLIRAAAVAAIGARLPAVQRALATALEASGFADPEALAAYWHGAGDDRRASAYAEAAAQRAAESLAFARAAELYDQALALAPPPERRHALHLGLGHAHASAGQGELAARAFRAAAATAASAAEAIELERRAAEQLLRCGQMREGVAVFEQVFRATGVRYARTPRRALASLALLRARIRLRGLGFRVRRAAALPEATLARIDTCWAAAAGIGFSDVIRGAELQARGLLLALGAGEPYRVCRALSAEACFRAAAGGPDDRQVARIIARAEALARELDSAHGLALCGLAGMLNAYCRGRWQETVDLAGPTIARFRDRCTGAYWEATSARHLRLWALAYLGRFGELAAETDAMLGDAATRADVYARNYLRTGMSNLLWLALDRPDEARAQASAALDEWPGEGFELQDYNALQALVHAELYQGDGAAARARLAGAWPQLRRTQLLGVQQIRIEMWHLRGCAALAIGDARGAARAAARVARERMAWGTPLADLLRGRYDEAAAGFDACGMAVHAGIARLRAGEARGGVVGDELAARADAALRARGIASPARWAAMWAPRPAAALSGGAPPPAT